MTNVYHIVFFTRDKSIYAFFKGCNFRCKGCILKLSPWDIHLPAAARSRLEGLKGVSALSLTRLGELLSSLEVKEAVLGGGEPTVDAELPSILKLLDEHGVRSILLTNGYNLNGRTVDSLRKAGLDEACVSIKAFTKELHVYYTGRPNERVLENFKLLKGSGIGLRAETVLIPKLIEVDEIERIARFVASVDPSIPFRIDGYVSVPTAPWRSAAPSEVREAVEASRKHLKDVSWLDGGVQLGGEAVNLYPTLEGIINGPAWKEAGSRDD